MTETKDFNQLPICCGLDVHKKSVSACLIVTSDNGVVDKMHKKFSTMTHDLENLKDWLLAYECNKVAMESTGIYWKALFNILEEASIETILANPRHVKNLPGKKTDIADSEWLAVLLRNGLLRGSFIPPHDIRELRDLTRFRVKVLEDRTRVKNRVQKLLEDANIKLASVVSDLFGVSGMDMLRALSSNGTVKPYYIAGLARGRLKNKKGSLQEAAYGRMSAHHRYILSSLLNQYTELCNIIEGIEAHIDLKVQPYKKHIELLSTIPGVDRNVAISIIAEIGVDMSRFPSDKHISSWAGICPGNNESAGKNRSGKMPMGNRHLKSALCQAAWAAGRARNTYLSKKFWALRSRRGPKKAVMAVAHKILIAAFHMLSNMEPYRELGPDYLENLKGNRAVSKMVQKLKTLGYEVTNPEERAGSLFLRSSPKIIMSSRA